MADGTPPTRTFRWDDPLDMDSRLTDDEGMIRDAARSIRRKKQADPMCRLWDPF